MTTAAVATNPNITSTVAAKVETSPISTLHDKFKKILEAAGLDLAKIPPSLQIKTHTSCGDQAVFFSNSFATVQYLSDMDKAQIRYGASIEAYSFSNRFTLADFTDCPNLFEVIVIKGLVKEACKAGPSKKQPEV